MAVRATTIEELGDGVFRKVRRALGVTAFGVNAVVLPPGTEWFNHYHERQDELYFVHRGTAGFDVGGERLEVGPGALVHVEAATPRRFWNAGEDELVLLAVGGSGGYVGHDGHLVDPADVERRRAFRAGDASVHPPPHRVGMEVRPARADDLPALFDVFTDAVGELYARHSFEPPDPPQDVFVRLHAHMLEHDSERFWVAEEERPVGFGAAIVRGDTWFLSALFVEPAQQSRGVGKELLRRAWDTGSGEARRRLTIVDSFQLVSTGLYSRAGLLPVTPILSLDGRPPGGGDVRLEAGEPRADALAELDLAAYGFDRAVDHAFWARHSRQTLWVEDGRPLAYSYRWPEGRIGPVAGRTEEAAGRALAAELAAAGDTYVSVIVPGSSRAALAAALAAGLRYADPPGLLLSTDSNPPGALVPYGYSLF
ncbi:MAG TPA: GNAT family N-acetyltransferase [Gaiellaceae bacterium]|nr:GNAT family N-acetyltransferase [Gaiellaceae bacterium]